ncbi:MAG: Glu-tRNA(Gln) amidotransferase subunit GatD, partial [Nanoarchaeota archaeon]
VEVILVKNSYRGIFLESPENGHGIVLLKLDSGYNIGFNKKDILEIKVLKRAEERKEIAEIRKDAKKPNIAIIMTGGTIANKYDPKTGAVAPLTSPEDLFKFYPGLFEIVNVIKIEIPFMKASEDMDFRDWQKIAKISVQLLNDSNIKGVLITHGTDTLHYTAAALSFFLKNLNKPVVLTYSQRSTDRASSDASLNLKCAAVAAISEIAEVMLVGHATTNDDYCYALRGTKVKKLHSSRRDAFKPVNTKPIAKIWPDRIEIVSEHNVRDNRKKVKTDTKFEEKVALIKIYPGQNPDILDYYSKRKYKGIVLEMSGLGHVPTKARKSWIGKLKEAQKKGLIVCGVAQTIYGRLDPYVYSNARETLKAGVIYLEDMLAETALVKLGWILGHGEWKKNRETIKAKMLENISGEFNERLEE